MPKLIWRGLIVSIGWFALSAQHPAIRNEARRDNAIFSRSTTAQNVKPAEISSSERIGIRCGPARYQSNDSLCAQWKAADAAADSAWWAWAGGVLGAASLAAVLAALGLAYHANHIARDTARRQLRAYIGVDSATIMPFKPIGGESANRRVAISIKNFGQTPAYIEKISLGVTLMGDPEQVPSTVPKTALECVTINPTHSATVAIEFAVDSDKHQSLEYDILHIVAHGKMTSVDIYGKRTDLDFSYITSGSAYLEKRMKEHRPKAAATIS